MPHLKIYLGFTIKMEKYYNLLELIFFRKLKIWDWGSNY